MPTYDYKCNDCGYTFEAFQKMSDNPLTECPECKGNVKRMIGTGLAPIFKGSGFYETDYKSAKKPNTSSTSTVSKSSTTTKSDTKVSTNDTKKAST